MSHAVDPNLSQRQASDPSASVWVAASAGSGKTKVLTDRVLRLLLSGTDPSRILCITYTRAAAAEMQSRIFDRLGGWAVEEEATLRADLEALTGRPPTPRTLQSARRLFTEALEESPGLRILTIHAFCQSVLARFPLEAGVPPNFQVVDDRTADELLDEARLRLLTGQELSSEAAQALEYLIGEASENAFSELVQAMVSQRRRFVRVLSQPGGLRRARTALYHAFGIEPEMTDATLLRYHFSYADDRLRRLREGIALLLQEGTSTDLKTGERMRGFLESDASDVARLEEYASAFLTQKGEVRKHLPTASLARAHPWLAELLQEEALRCRSYRESAAAWDNAALSAHTLTLAATLFGLYERLKRQRGMLDYDDLILRARALLCDQDALAWVLYKLDGGIDHLLLDEAQDTSAEQWAITRKLAEEFYAGLSARDHDRTLFVVGDRKQSIYRFQGAEPGDFLANRLHFAQSAQASRHEWREVRLDISFRSVQAVLDAVDATFHLPSLQARFLAEEEDMRHRAFRDGQAGRVELWPLCEGPDRQRPDAWPLPGEAALGDAPAQTLARRIARTIRRWLDDGRTLAATGRPVTPGDILILVRRRSGGISSAIANALRQAHVPVAGLDRLELTSALAVKDLMALGHVLLLPQGDLNLACVLKSPLYGIGEESLFILCHGRERQPLWERLMAYAGNDPRVMLARDELRQLHLHQAGGGHFSPYEFYTELLHARDAAKRFTARMGEGVRELLETFLEQARTYELSHPPSLQGFLHWLEHGRTELKRDMEHSADEVRIMTVHGAKGLEAPIVFLPDTTSRQGRAEVSLLADQHDGTDIIVRLPGSKEQDSALTATLRRDKEAADYEEYTRLLYVAMTRARDELYVCGIGGEKTAEDCWYHLIRQGMQGLEGVITESTPEGERLVYATGAPAAASRRPPAGQRADALALPGYFHLAPPPEDPRQRMLHPSRLTEERMPAFSPTETLGLPLDETGISAAERGTLIHRLLHILSPVAPARRGRVAMNFLERYHRKLPEGRREGMVRQILLLMDDPIYRPVFSPEALSEVSVSGLVEDARLITGQTESLALSGQIDRLVVTPEQVLVVDFKTGELPPGFGVPEPYRRQMEAYRQLLRRIYPQHAIECALIYTVAPVLIPVPAILTPPQAVAI